MKNLKLTKVLSLILFTVSLTVVANDFDISDEKYNEINNKVNSMNYTELAENEKLLISEIDQINNSLDSTQNPSQIKSLTSRLNAISAELSLTQKLLLAAVGVAGINALTDDGYNDEIPPVITIQGDNPVTVELGSAYTDAGATAFDAFHGNTSVTSSGTVDTSAVGSYTITYTATDLDNNTATSTRVVNVVDTTAPVITLLGDNPATAELGEAYTDAGASAISRCTNCNIIYQVQLNSYCSYDFWNCRYQYIGIIYTNTYTSSDASGNTTTETRNVNVVDSNPPVFTSSATFTAAENQTAIGTVVANDGNGGFFDVTYSLEDNAAGNGFSNFAIEVDTGVLSFKSAPDYETLDSYGPITVVASDGTNTSSQDITVTITDANDAPTVTSSATFTAAENQTAIGTVTATDADGDSVSFSLEDNAAGNGFSNFAIEVDTGVLSFKSAPDYETLDSYGPITIVVSDGTAETRQDISVTITDANDAPTVTSSATFTAAENQTAIGTVTATDADGDSVSFSLEDNAAGNGFSNFAIEVDTGVLSFKSAPDYETLDSYGPITIVVSDGTAETRQDISVTITDANDAPTVTSSATFTAAENQTAIGLVTATDADGDALSFSLEDNAAGNGFANLAIKLIQVSYHSNLHQIMRLEHHMQLQ